MYDTNVWVMWAPDGSNGRCMPTDGFIRSFDEEKFVRL